MKRFGSAFLILALGVLGTAPSGCVGKGKRDRDRAAAAPRAPRFIGTIALVNEEQRFVLIDHGAHSMAPSGAALKSFTQATESAVLSVGSVRRRPFVIADIVKGAPKKGDAVYE